MSEFKLGLVMAGAISAGAYTAGVVDFLIQALDEWEKQKAGADPGVPRHDVRLKVISGASAGAITGAISVGALSARCPPVGDASSPHADNKLFDCWVDRIDISSLLEHKDLPGKKSPVVSLLDSTVLREIADNAFDVQPADAPRPYVDRELHVFASVTNLRGVPYNISLQGERRIGHGMQMHADYMHFVVSEGGKAAVPGALPLDWRMRELKLKPNWEVLKTAALASGAFPVGLAPRLLERTISGTDDAYGQRSWTVPGPGKQDGECVCFEPKQIPPFWPFLPEPYSYKFLCVDGGVMNNEPLELARQILAGPGERNPRGEDEADRAVVLVDPFPDVAPFPLEYDPPADLPHFVLRLFGALKNQARFKPEEIVLAQRDDVYSRFLVSPVRQGLAEDQQQLAIACGVLGGFGGFLSRDFRAHDFILGRRNCQQFLRRHFVLGEKNKLFDGWSAEAKKRFAVQSDGKTYLPIVPLVGDCANEIPARPWPVYTPAALDRLRGQVKDRMTRVIEGLVMRYFEKHFFLIRWIAEFAIKWKTGDMLDFCMDTITKDLRKFGLLK